MKKIGNRRARLKEEIEPQLVLLEWLSNKGVVSMRRVWSSKEKIPITTVNASHCVTLANYLVLKDW